MRPSAHTRPEIGRPLTVVLTETDWRRLRALEPDLVAWLRRKVDERLAEAPQAEPSP